MREASGDTAKVRSAVLIAVTLSASMLVRATKSAASIAVAFATLPPEGPVCHSGDRSEACLHEQVVLRQPPSRAGDLRDLFLIGRAAGVQSYRTEAESRAIAHQLGAVDQVEMQSYRHGRRVRDSPQRRDQRSKCAPVIGNRAPADLQYDRS